MKQTLVKLTALSMIVDGALLAAIGRRYARVWFLGMEQGPYAAIVRWFVRRPQWQQRLVGLSQALAGVGLLRRTPS